MTDAPLYASRYPGYDVMAKTEAWDEVTRRVVEARVRDVPRVVFFSRAEADAIRALMDVVLPQDDRPPGKRVPIVERLDARLHAGQGPGWRFEDVPDDRTLWRRIARMLDEARFAQMRPQERVRLVERFAKGEVPLEGASAARAWSLVLAEAVTHYYAHPYAWSEIGFGGPKFPGIYPRPARDNPDEAEEVWRG